MRDIDIVKEFLSNSKPLLSYPLFQELRYIHAARRILTDRRYSQASKELADQVFRFR